MTQLGVIKCHGMILGSDTIQRIIEFKGREIPLNNFYY